MLQAAPSAQDRPCRNPCAGPGAGLCTDTVQLAHTARTPACTQDVPTSTAWIPEPQPRTARDGAAPLTPIPPQSHRPTHRAATIGSPSLTRAAPPLSPRSAGPVEARCRRSYLRAGPWLPAEPQRRGGGGARSGERRAPPCPRAANGSSALFALFAPIGRAGVRQGAARASTNRRARPGGTPEPGMGWCGPARTSRESTEKGRGLSPTNGGAGGLRARPIGCAAPRPLVRARGGAGAGGRGARL